MVNFGKPEAVSASTRTRWAATPTAVAGSDVATVGRRSLNERRGTAARRRRGRRPAGGEAGERRREGIARVGRNRSGTTARSELAGGVDRQRVAGRDRRAAQPVPALQVAHRRAVL